MLNILSNFAYNTFGRMINPMGFVAVNTTGRHGFRWFAGAEGGGQAASNVAKDIATEVPARFARAAMQEGAEQLMPGVGIHVANAAFDGISAATAETDWQTADISPFEAGAVAAFRTAVQAGAGVAAGAAGTAVAGPVGGLIAGGGARFGAGMAVTNAYTNYLYARRNAEMDRMCAEMEKNGEVFEEERVNDSFLGPIGSFVGLN